MPETVTPPAEAPEPSVKITILGPFLGHVTTASIRVWLHLEGGPGKLWVTAHPASTDAEPVASGLLEFAVGTLFTGWADLQNLAPDSHYFYRFWTNPACSFPYSIEGLTNDDLHFWTLSDDPEAQIDFLVMSCHNPVVAKADGFEGHAMWADLPQIISRHSNRNVRFALLVGDQVYADAWQERLLKEKTDEGRMRLYLEVYRTYWCNIYYRRVMCRLPAVMMWDDHDITDGWGSDEKSYAPNSDDFLPNWKAMFEAAFKTFSIMQASRNPAPLAANPRDGLDFAFRVGRWGFLFLDLRTNRNWKRQQLLTEDQAARIRAWVEANREGMRALFVVSPVVFSHGSPLLEKYTVKVWPWVMRAVDAVLSNERLPWGRALRTKFWDSAGDIRDDIRDSWGDEGKRRRPMRCSTSSSDSRMRRKIRFPSS